MPSVPIRTHDPFYKYDTVKNLGSHTIKAIVLKATCAYILKKRERERLPFILQLLSMSVFLELHFFRSHRVVQLLC